MFQYTFGTSVGMEEERGENTNNNGHVKAILFNAKKGIRAAMVQRHLTSGFFQSWSQHYFAINNEQTHLGGYCHLEN